MIDGLLDAVAAIDWSHSRIASLAGTHHRVAARRLGSHPSGRVPYKCSIEKVAETWGPREDWTKDRRSWRRLVPPF
jgi:hypothetical protein